MGVKNPGRSCIKSEQTKSSALILALTHALVTLACVRPRFLMTMVTEIGSVRFVTRINFLRIRSPVNDFKVCKFNPGTFGKYQVFSLTRCGISGFLGSVGCFFGGLSGALGFLPQLGSGAIQKAGKDRHDNGGKSADSSIVAFQPLTDTSQPIDRHRAFVSGFIFVGGLIVIVIAILFILLK